MQNNTRGFTTDVPLSSMIDRTLLQPRSTRDLRAEMLSLAAELAISDLKGRLVVRAPVISAQTVQDEWNRMLGAIATHVRDRMSLAILPDVESSHYQARGKVPAVRLGRPNYRYEILRILLDADLNRDEPPTIQDLIREIGASQTPIRGALEELKSSGLVRGTPDGLRASAEDVSLEALARTRAIPPTIRFRFELGASLKSPALLQERAKALLGSSTIESWSTVALSGVPAARLDAPAMDIAGTPRLDLVAMVSRSRKSFDATMMRQLDDGLEPQASILEPAPVVMTLVRSHLGRIRQSDATGPRYASRSDVLLSLLDLGLRERAREFLRAIRT
jgi:hypothetical protein